MINAHGKPFPLGSLDVTVIVRTFEIVRTYRKNSHKSHMQPNLSVISRNALRDHMSFCPKRKSDNKGSLSDVAELEVQLVGKSAQRANNLRAVPLKLLTLLNT
jgi:hypothetical protein